MFRATLNCFAETQSKTRAWAEMKGLKVDSDFRGSGYTCVTIQMKAISCNYLCIYFLARTENLNSF